MNKYVSFLLVPIILFGINNNICYSMEDSDSNDVTDANIDDNNKNMISQELLQKYHDLYRKNLKLYVYYKN